MIGSSDDVGDAHSVSQAAIVTTVARLRAFVAVADTGSVRAAATRLFITTSAVSSAISALSQDVGVALFEKEGRGLRLTSGGRIYAEYSRTILGLHEQALDAVRGDLEPERGRIRMAAVITAGDHVLAQVLAGFLGKYPEVDLRLEVATSERVWASLSNHESDIVIAGRPPARLSGDVVVQALSPNELLVVAAPGLAAEFDLAGTTWLMRGEGSGTRATCEGLLTRLDVNPPRLTLGSNGAVIAGALAGLGVTLISKGAVARQLAEGELVAVPVNGTPMRRPWHAVTHRRPSASVRLFVDYLIRQPAGADADVSWHVPRSSPTGSTGRGS